MLSVFYYDLARFCCLRILSSSSKEYSRDVIQSPRGRLAVRMFRNFSVHLGVDITMYHGVLTFIEKFDLQALFEICAKFDKGLYRKSSLSRLSRFRAGDATLREPKGQNG